MGRVAYYPAPLNWPLNCERWTKQWWERWRPAVFSFGDCSLNRGKTGQQQVDRPRRKIIGVKEEANEETEMAQNLIHNIYTCLQVLHSRA